MITRLNTADLKPGRHQFWFRSLDTGTGESWHIPVQVFKAKRSGLRMMFTSGIHGDELNGVLAAQQLGRELQGLLPQLSGTVTVVSGINTSGIVNHARDFIPSDPDASPTNLNRCFPGDPRGDSGQRYVANVWSNLLAANADRAIELHTQTKGAAYPLLAFADYRQPKAVEMARQLHADFILDDPGQAGVLETQWNTSGVPCITVEIGAGKHHQPELIERAVTGLKYILAQQGILDDADAPRACDCFEGKATETVRADIGGYASPLVKLGEQVRAGQEVAVQWDAFGDEAKRYKAPVSGRVLSLNTDPLREPGTLLVRIITG